MTPSDDGVTHLVSFNSDAYKSAPSSIFIDDKIIDTIDGAYSQEVDFGLLVSKRISYSQSFSDMRICVTQYDTNTDSLFYSLLETSTTFFQFGVDEEIVIDFENGKLYVDDLEIPEEQLLLANGSKLSLKNVSYIQFIPV